MRKQVLRVPMLLILATLLAVPAGVWAQAATMPDTKRADTGAGVQPMPSQRADTGRGTEWVERQVRHELVMLPFYGVFDNLMYKVNGDEVTLLGQVTRPTLKADAEAAVKRIEGVETVNNQIEVLPVSDNDDRVRMATYRAVYGEGPLDRYAMQAVPPIHIIVKNGNVTLEGVVNSEMDRTLAVTRAKAVSGVFSVTDHLQVEQASNK